MLDQMLKEYVETAKQQAESVSDMLRTRKPMVFRFLRPSADEE